MELLRENVSVRIGEKKRTVGKSRFQINKKSKRNVTDKTLNGFNNQNSCTIYSLHLKNIFIHIFFFFSLLGTYCMIVCAMHSLETQQK